MTQISPSAPLAAPALQRPTLLSANVVWGLSPRAQVQSRSTAMCHCRRQGLAHDWGGYLRFGHWCSHAQQRGRHCRRQGLAHDWCRYLGFGAAGGPCGTLSLQPCRQEASLARSASLAAAGGGLQSFNVAGALVSASCVHHRRAENGDCAVARISDWLGIYPGSFIVGAGTFTSGTGAVSLIAATTIADDTDFIVGATVSTGTSTIYTAPAQSGAVTFSTGTGAVTLNGDMSLPTARTCT